MGPPRAAESHPRRSQLASAPLPEERPDNYPALISIADEENCDPPFANLHNWRFSENGVDPVDFDNDASFRFGADVTISGSGDGEAGIGIPPWWSQDVDGRFNVRTTDGEVACFGGRLPFYSFTASHGVSFVKGDVIYLEIVYTPNLTTEWASISYENTEPVPVEKKSWGAIKSRFAE